MNLSDSAEWEIPQHKIMEKLDLLEIRILRLTKEYSNIRNHVDKQDLIMENIRDNIEKISDKLDEHKEDKVEDLKIMVKEIQKSHATLQENLASIYFKQRRDNIFWRSYNNKFSNNCNNFMGLNTMLFADINENPQNGKMEENENIKENIDDDSQNQIRKHSNHRTYSNNSNNSTNSNSENKSRTNSVIIKATLVED
jgi:hypothetical protein